MAARWLYRLDFVYARRLCQTAVVALVFPVQSARHRIQVQVQRQYVNVLADLEPQNVKQNTKEYCLVFHAF